MRKRQVYSILKQNKNLAEHLQRHLHSSKVPGSCFRKSIFPSVKKLINFASKHIKGYKGKRKHFVVKFDKIIGEEAIIPLSKVPKGMKVKRVKREKDSYPINLVKGMKKIPTNQLIIIVGPLPDKKHGILTIFPGKYYPAFPQTRKQLVKKGYKGKELKKKFIQNKKLLKKWDKLVFIG